MRRCVWPASQRMAECSVIVRKKRRRKNVIRVVY
jgi:hypothetical protein